MQGALILGEESHIEKKRLFYKNGTQEVASQKKSCVQTNHALRSNTGIREELKYVIYDVIRQLDSCNDRLHYTLIRRCNWTRDNFPICIFLCNDVQSLLPY